MSVSEGAIHLDAEVQDLLNSATDLRGVNANADPGSVRQGHEDIPGTGATIVRKATWSLQKILHLYRRFL